MQVQFLPGLPCYVAKYSSQCCSYMKEGKKQDMRPRICTQSCIEYLQYEPRIINFFLFVYDLVRRSDEVRRIAAEALAFDPIAEQQGEKPKKIENKLETTKFFYRNHMPMMREFLLVRLVDNYQKYLADILFEIFLHKPELLRSDAEVKISAVLENESMEAFIRSYAEKKVEGLTRKSFVDIYEYFQKKLGIRLIDEKDLIKLAIAIRNISVHNRCVINKRFIDQTGENPSNKGKVKEVANDLLKELLTVLPKSVISIDNQVRKKLKMKGKRFYQALGEKLVQNK